MSTRTYLGSIFDEYVLPHQRGPVADFLERPDVEPASAEWQTVVYGLTDAAAAAFKGLLDAHPNVGALEADEGMPTTPGQNPFAGLGTSSSS